MNYFIEGLQGSGKSTLAERLAALHPECRVFHEGDHSPVELAWCAFVSRQQYDEILEKYGEIRAQIEEKSFEEGEHVVICYTQIRTDVPGFYRDLEQHEIYNGRIEYPEFRRIVLDRYQRWNDDNGIFECSLFQNAVEDMILFRLMNDDEIIDFYRDVREVLQDRNIHIVYLLTEDIETNISVIRRERSDEKGNELWFPLMMDYFENSPYAITRIVSGEQALMEHLQHRQQLELRICRELFPGQHTILKSKNYGDLEKELNRDSSQDASSKQ